jgi:hypothetical protein
MGFIIRQKEPPDAEVRRVLLGLNRRALGLLERWTENPRDRVHRARQTFKRARALLRLVRPGARYVYRVENAFYRGLGRKLAYARDTEAVIDALSLLESRVSGPLAQESLRMLKIGLQQRAARERDSGLNDLAGRIGSACDELAGAEKRLRDMPLDGLRRKDLKRGVQYGMERCTTAFRRASDTKTAEDFHDLRTDVKHAYHQTHLMRQIMPRWAATSGAELGLLAEVLGHHQDLVVLDALLRGQADELNVDVHLRAMRNAVRMAMAELAADALARGAQMFDAAGPARDNVVGDQIAGLSADSGSGRPGQPLGRESGAGECRPVDQVHPALRVLGDRRAVFDPVPAVEVVNAVAADDLRSVDVAEDAAIEAEPEHPPDGG